MVRPEKDENLDCSLTLLIINTEYNNSSSNISEQELNAVDERHDVDPVGAYIAGVAQK